MPELAADALAVGARGGAARAVMANRLASHTTAEWLTVLGGLDVCVEPLPSLHQAFGAGAQTGVSHVVVELDGRPVTLPAQGVGFPGCPPATRRAPQLGEDTARVRALVAAGTDLRRLWQDSSEAPT